jgi:cytochrome c55X
LTQTRPYRTTRRSPSAAGLRSLAAVAATALAAAGLAAPPLGAEELAPQSARRLSDLVRQDCGSCHGLTLKGGLGKPLTAEALAQWDRDQIAALILNGVPGTPMPPWRPLLSEAEARFIADMLKRGELQ